MSTDPDLFALPPRAVLLHVGPHKTGTTAVQRSVFDARKALAGHGVVVPYDEPHPRSAVRAAIGHAAGSRGREASMAAWRAVADRVRRAQGERAFVSSEMLATADDERIAAIVGDLGADRVWVVITLRSLSHVLPSQWQQHLRNRETLSFDAWLERVLRQPTSRAAEDFWARHDHGALVRRWADRVGADRVVVVVADDRRPEHLLRCFERLLGAPGGTLREGPRTNRSFTVGEAELVRLLNLEASARSLPDADYTRLIRDDLCHRLQARTPPPGDARLRLPAVARDAVVQRQAAIVEEVRASGARVVGDLERLRVEPELAPPTAPPPLEEAVRLLSQLGRSHQALAAIRSLDVRAGLRHLTRGRRLRGGG